MSHKDVKPIFLICSPRTGSTLLQRILASHSKISSEGETHLLLPLLYAIRKEGVYSEYNHQQTFRGIRNFLYVLPDKTDSYLRRIQKLVISLFNEAANEGAVYFLDKTPFYPLIAEDIIRTFPDGKFIVLWRNPLAMISSVVRQWGERRGRGWFLYPVYNVLTKGITHLVDTTQKYKESVLVVKFEELIENPELELKKIMTYLELEFEEEMLKNFSKINMNGKLGDPTGVKRYQSISREPLEKWKKTLAFPLRKAWCRRYLKWLGKERLNVMGYDLNKLQMELNNIPTCYRNIHIDVISMIIDNMLIQFRKQVMGRLAKVRIPDITH